MLSRLKYLPLAVAAAFLPSASSGQVVLNPPDVYLSVVTKDSQLPALDESTAVVRIGNGFASNPIVAPTRLTVTMDAPLATSLAKLGTAWAKLSNGSAVCDAIDASTAVNGQVSVSCMIPPLGTGKSVDLEITLVGQDPWTQSGLRFKMDTLPGEVQTANQNEDLRITWYQAADLEIKTEVFDPERPATPVATYLPGGSSSSVAAQATKVFDFVSTVTNAGPSAAANVTVQITKSLGLSHYKFPAGSTCQVTAFEDDEVYSCVLPVSLKPGESYQLAYSAQLDAPTTAGAVSAVSLNNSVQLPSGFQKTRDSNSDNNAVTPRFTVSAGTDVAIAKALPNSKSTIAAGETLRYRLTPSYIGSSPERIVIEDVLPEGLSFVQIEPANYCDVQSIVGQTFRCEVVVAADAHQSQSPLPSFELIGTVGDFAEIGARQLVNTATVQVLGPLTDTNPANNSASTPALTVEAPYRELTARKSRVLRGGGDGFVVDDKQLEKSFAVVGDQLLFELKATNTGNVGLTDKVIITDKLPLGMAYTGFTSDSPWTCAPQGTPDAKGLWSGPRDIVCTYIYPQGTTLDRDQTTPALTLEADVIGALNEDGQLVSKLLINGAEPSWEGPGPGLDNFLTAESTVSIEALDSVADLSVLKSRVHAERETGSWQRYDLTPINAGSTQTIAGVTTHYPFASQKVELRDRLSNLYTPFVDDDSTVKLINNPGGACRLLAVQGNAYAADLVCAWETLAYCEPGSSGNDCPLITVETRQGGLPNPGADLQPNSAMIFSALTPETNYDNNTAAVEHKITPLFDLAIEKTTNLADEAVQIGKAFEFEIRVNNVAKNPDNTQLYTASTPFTVTDTLPEGLRINSITSASMECKVTNLTLPGLTSTNSSFTCTHPGGLGLGSGATITLSAEGPVALTTQLRASPDRTLKMVNNANIGFLNAEDKARDIDHTNHDAFSTVSFVDGKYDIAVTKAVDQAFVYSGEMVSFTIRVENVGLIRAEAVQVVDGLPRADLFKFDAAKVTNRAGASCGPIQPGFAEEFTSANGLSPGAVGAGQKLTCTLGDMLPGEVAYIKVSGRMLGAGSDRNFTSATAERDRDHADPTYWTDDLNYLNNSDFTSVTAQELVDVTMQKSLIQPPLQTYFKYNDTMTFALNVVNVSRSAGAVYDDPILNAMVPYFTDASNVVVEDTLPNALIFTGALRITGMDPALCPPPTAGSKTYSCTISSLPNGADVTFELDTVIDPDHGDLCTNATCVTATDGNQYFETTNTAQVKTSSYEPSPAPNKDEAPVKVLLSSLSGHYWWDMQFNTPADPTTAQGYSPAQGDSYVDGRELILQVNRGTTTSPQWVEYRRNTTGQGEQADGFYQFNYLPPAEYRVIDATTFNASQVATTQIADEGGVLRDAILGVVSQGSIPNSTPGDLGNPVQTGTGERGFTTITLGEDRHGVNYDLRIIPAPTVGLTKSTPTAPILHPNGLYEITYQINIANTSREPLRDLSLKDPLSRIFTAHSPSLQALGEAAKTSRSLGAGVNYAVRSATLGTVPAQSAIFLNPLYQGVEAISDDLFLPGSSLAPGATVGVTLKVYVNLGQPLFAQGLKFTNLATVKGTGEWTKFTHDPGALNGIALTTPNLLAEGTVVSTPTLTESLSIVKTMVPRASLNATHNGKIAYSFKITNTGTVPLSNITLTDTMLGITGTNRTADLDKLYLDLNGTKANAPVPAALDLLLAKESITLYGYYELSSGDFANLDTNPSITKTNIASVTGIGSNPTVPTKSTSQTVNATVGVSLVKVVDAGLPTPILAGQEITYRVRMTNTGVLPYIGAQLDDQVLLASGGRFLGATGVSVTAANDVFTLPAQSQAEFSFGYSVTQADIDAIAADPGRPLLQVISGGNKLANTAQLSGSFGPNPTTSPKTEREASVETLLLPQAAFTAVKIAAPRTPTGQDAGGNPMTQPGDLIDYAVLVTNTGSNSLTRIDLSDALVGLGSTAWTPPPGQLLAPQQSVLFYAPGMDISGQTATYAVPQALSYTLLAQDLDAGTLKNIAQVTVTPVVGPPPPAQTPEVSTPFARQPAITLVKEVLSPSTNLVFDESGQANLDVTYRFTATNTGNVTLSNVTLTDPLLLLTGADAHLMTATLAAGQAQSWTYAFRYQLDRTLANYADLVTMLDAFSGGAGTQNSIITNTASVAGTTPTGTPVTQVTDTDTAPITVDMGPALEIVKTGAKVAMAAGDLVPMIDWTITVTNTGNVTLSDIAFKDPRAGQDFTIARLAPREVWTQTLRLPTTLAERDQGFAQNSLTEITANTPDGDEYTPPDVAAPDVPLEAGDYRYGLEIEKSADPGFNLVVNPASTATELTYHFRIRNTGNVSLSDLVFNDAKLGLIDLRRGQTPSPTADVVALSLDLPQTIEPQTDLTAATGPSPDADGWYYLGTATVRIGLAWVDNGQITNTASIQGTPSNGTPPLVAEDDEIVPLYQSPRFTATKTAALVEADPSLGTRVGDQITWSIAVENTGNVTLYGVTVAEADYFATAGSQPQWVAGVVQEASSIGLTFAGDTATISQLQPGQTAQLQLTNIVTADLLASGLQRNRATVTADHIFAPPLTPVDWDKVLTPEAEVPFTFRPAQSITKTWDEAQSAACVSNGTLTGACRAVFKIVVENTGNIALSSLQVTEQVADMQFTTEATLAGNQTGTAGVLSANGTVFTLTGPALQPGATLTLYSVYDLTAVPNGAQLIAANAGRISNLAEVTGKALDPRDGSELPTPPTDATAEAIIAQLPAISLEKTAYWHDAGDGSALETATDGSWKITGATLNTQIGYRFTITNTGNVTLDDISLYDPRLLGSALGINGLGPLVPGQSVTYDSTDAILTGPDFVTPTQAELDAGLIDNQARVDGTFGPGQIPYEAEDDVSTVLVPEAALQFEKTASEVLGEPGLIRYTFTVQNIGQVSLHEVVIADDGISPGWTHRFDGISLAPQGAPLEFSVDYPISQQDRETGWVINTASVSALPDSPNPDVAVPPVVEDSVYVPVPGTPVLHLTKIADDAQITVPPDLGQKVLYRFVVENQGLVTVQNIRLSDELPQVTFDDGGLLASLAPGESHTFTGSYPLQQADLDAGEVRNRAHVTGSFIPPQPPVGSPVGPITPLEPVSATSASQNQTGDDAPTVTPLIMAGEFIAQKSADLERVYLGDRVQYSLSFDSQSTGRIAAVDLIDQLPQGLIYTPETALVEIRVGDLITRTEAPVEPQVLGRRLVWRITDVPRLGQIRIRFDARVSAIAPYGKLTNQTWSQTPEGTKNSNTATATVIREVEHVFECSDVTGKVFDDQNQNGRQDMRDTSALTNDDIYIGKFGKYEDLPKEPQGERGLPHVRLVTPTGTVITTDEHGRYSVPCAELPGDLGSNFTLKLDTRSLPSGYRVTTENPRTLRLTAGKAAQMNFGATLSKLVRLDLNAQAFVPGKAEPTPALDQALRDFAKAQADVPMVVHLGYQLGPKEGRDLARKRLDLLERQLGHAWKGRRANLIIERSYQQTSK